MQTCFIPTLGKRITSMDLKPINILFSAILKNYVQHCITDNFPQKQTKIKTILIKPVLLVRAFTLSGLTKLILILNFLISIIKILFRIVATFARDSQFRCPICRELINIPRGGVQALPPSFLVNQLLDLMASQRREVIPKCSTHANQVRVCIIFVT